jgi:two-component system chemotaxis response regulator CheV
MSQTKILLEAGTNELEIVEFYIDEPVVELDSGTSSALKLIEEEGREPIYRGYYGVNVAKVLEIIQLPHVTPLPELQSPSVLGAFNLRSKIIPLVDLNIWLEKNNLDNYNPPKVVVTEFNNVTTAFKVSGVNRIHRISWEDVEAPNSYMSFFSKGCITGVVRLEDRIVFILDLEKIVTELNPTLGLRLDNAIDWKQTPKYRAIVCDDSSLIRNMLKTLLQEANFDVRDFTNGQEAWDELCSLRSKAIEENKDISDYVQVLISDIEMPRMDGHTLCKTVKEDPYMKKIPVILFSSLITDKLRHKGNSVGADEQISKPGVTQLAQRAHELIQQYAAGYVPEKKPQSEELK